MAVALRGLAEVNRAFAKLDKDITNEWYGYLKDAAAPVQVRAEARAVERISHIGDRWSRMRIGATKKVVYVAPKQRRRSSSPQRRRPNLAPLLMTEAMEPALEESAREIERLLEIGIDKITGRF